VGKLRLRGVRVLVSQAENKNVTFLTKFVKRYLMQSLDSEKHFDFFRLQICEGFQVSLIIDFDRGELLQI